MLGFSMQCGSLSAQLLNFKYKRSRDKSTDDDGQMRLFHMTLEQREEFTKFAANLRWIISDSTDAEAYWKGHGEHQYTDYEFRKLFDPFQKDKTEAAIALLEKVGNGVELTDEEFRTTMDFLNMLQAYAHANTHHGGCFG